MLTPRAWQIGLLLFAVTSAPLRAEIDDGPVDIERQREPTNPSFHYYVPPRDRLRERSLIAPPIFSLLVPGLDQWWEGQAFSALAYSGIGAAGVFLYLNAEDSADNRYKDFAQQVFLTGGSMSLYHSFRTAVTTRRPVGEFLFLTRYETPPDLIGAPVRFDYMLRSTTWVPLLAAGVFFFGISPGLNLEGMIFSDFFYAGSMSYMTGVGEELLFRGYAMPLAMHYTGSETKAIAISAALFAGAHGLRFQHFITSFLFGLYTGWLSQKRDWTLSECIFLHTWWDVLVFLADYSSDKDRAVLRIPTLQFRF